MSPKDLMPKAATVLTEESLKVFVQGMAELDSQFSKMMYEGSDFTLRLEVRGCAGKLIHCRSYSDQIRKPKEPGK